MDSGLFKVNTNLNEYNLENAFSIARSIVQIDSLKGNFSLKINADGSISDPLATVVSGTVKMKDGSIGCHCEHTVLVTSDGYEVLTLPD